MSLTGGLPAEYTAALREVQQATMAQQVVVRRAGRSRDGRGTITSGAWATVATVAAGVGPMDPRDWAQLDAERVQGRQLRVFRIPAGTEVLRTDRLQWGEAEWEVLQVAEGTAPETARQVLAAWREAL